MIALAIVWGALIIDLALVCIAARGAGLSWTVGPLRVRLHDPHNPIILAASLAAILLVLSWPHARRRTWALAAMAAVVGVAGIAIARQAQRIFPIGDIAVLELYVRDALTGKLLVGPYSRFGWHHPGPLYFYATAPLYALGGRQPAALAAGAAAVAIAAVCLIAWSGARSLGPATTAALLAFVALFVWRLPDLVSSPWNPHVVVLPSVALLACCAALAAGDAPSLPVSVVLASAIVQTDIPLLPMCLALILVSTLAGFVAMTQRGEGPKMRRALSVAAWLVAALWLIPAVEEITHSPGNLTLLWRFFVLSPGTGQPFSTALPAWATMLAAPILPGLSLPGGGTFAAAAPALSMSISVLELLALAVIVGWAARKHDRQVAWLAGLGLLASIVGLWSVTRIADRIMDHEIFWLAGLGLFNAAVIAGSAAVFLLPCIQIAKPMAPIFNALTISICAFICLDQLQRAKDGHLPVTLSSPVAARLGASMRTYVTDHGVHRPLVRIGEDVWGMAAGALLELNRAGVPFAVEDSWTPMFPQAFAANGREDAEITFSDADAHLALAARPGNEAIADGGSAYIDAIRLKK